MLDPKWGAVCVCVCVCTQGFLGCVCTGFSVVCTQGFLLYVHVCVCSEMDYGAHPTLLASLDVMLHPKPSVSPLSPLTTSLSEKEGTFQWQRATTHYQVSLWVGQAGHDGCW
jgi:hypothetical protein